MCGTMKMAFVDLEKEQTFVNVDFTSQSITLQRGAFTVAGTYEKAYLRFYYEENPLL